VPFLSCKAGLSLYDYGELCPSSLHFSFLCLHSYGVISYCTLVPQKTPDVIVRPSYTEAFGKSQREFPLTKAITPCTPFFFVADSHPYLKVAKTPFIRNSMNSPPLPLMRTCLAVAPFSAPGLQKFFGAEPFVSSRLVPFLRGYRVQLVR